MEENYLDCSMPGQSQKGPVQTVNPVSEGRWWPHSYFHVNKNGWIPFKKWEEKDHEESVKQNVLSVDLVMCLWY